MLDIAKQASDDVEKYLRGLKETIDVVNVENDKRFQKKDIDLLWIYMHNDEVHTKKLEVKGDRYSKTGNFFLETNSNIEKGTEGCFMYTEADYIYYYFVDTKELNVIPVKESRKWFIENMERFVEKKLSTKVGVDKFYTSAGRLVPKNIMRKELGTRYKLIQ